LTFSHASIMNLYFFVSSSLLFIKLDYAQNPLHTFPCKFPIDGEAANLLRTC